MNGYIEYNDASKLSPLYPHSIIIGDQTYTSVQHAIQSGEDPYESILTLVRQYRSVYEHYRFYTFQGTYSDLLNAAISALLIAKREPLNIDRHVYILDVEQHIKAKQLPVEFSLPIIRNVYVTTKENGNVHRQVRALDVVETYNVFLYGNLTLYVGGMGSFILLDDPLQDVSSVLQRLTE